MCGRYAATAHPDELVEEFDISFVADDLGVAGTPRYNIAPTDSVAGVVERVDGQEVTRKLVPLRWGLVPSWAKAPSASMINARVESVTEKPAFRKAASARRCLLPALGYYEWRPEAPDGAAKPFKQPYFLTPGSGWMVMAGLFWKGRGLGRVDDDHSGRTVPRDAWDDWLDPTVTDSVAAVSLLTTPELATPYRVSRAVSTVGNDGPPLVAPSELWLNSGKSNSVRFFPEDEKKRTT